MTIDSRTLHQRVRSLLAVTIVLCLVVSGWAGGRISTAAQIDGSTYVDPTYGYTLSWDDAIWSVIDDAGGDIALESDLVQVFFQSGQFYDGDAVACRDDLVARLPDDASVESVEAFADGEGLESDAADRAWSTLAVELSEASVNDATSIIERIECRTLVVEEAVLAITWIAPLDDAEGAIAEAESLLSGLETPNNGGEPTAGLGEDRYDDQDYGFTIEWDPEAWSAFVPVDTTFGLDSGVSLITFDLPTDFAGDAEACLIASVETLRESPGLEELRDLQRDGQDETGEGDAGWISAAFEADYGASQRFVEIRCASLPGEAAVLRALHSGPLEAWEDEAELAAPVFASFALPSSDATPVAEPAPSTPVRAGTPESDDAATSGDPVTFQPESGEWSLTYDGSLFTPLDAGLYQTVDLALSGPQTVVTFQSVETSDDPATILANRVATEIGDVDSDAALAEPPIGTVDGAIGATYEVTGQGDEAGARGVIVVPTGTGVVIVRLFGTPESYEADYEALSTLMDGLEVTD
ncbi:MAG TPA: hypothetical protein VGT61_09400 [Thermomicrobiales bacterium]|nr:hypothetical protein [Thermomicrobiales bacterium]